MKRFENMAQLNDADEKTKEELETLSVDELHELNLYKCANCGEMCILNSDDYSDPEYFSICEGNGYIVCDEKMEGLWCQGCYSGFSEYASTIIIIVGTDKHKLKTYDGVVVDTAQWDGGCEDLPYNFKSTVKELNPHYVSTDAWRGYIDVDTPSGYAHVREGWHSTMSESDFSERIKEVMEGHYNLDYPVIVFLGMTSNVFSVGIDVFVPEEYDNDFERLLNGVPEVGHEEPLCEPVEIDADMAVLASALLPAGGIDVEVTELDKEKGTAKVRTKQRFFSVSRPNE